MFNLVPHGGTSTPGWEPLTYTDNVDIDFVSDISNGYVGTDVGIDVNKVSVNDISADFGDVMDDVHTNVCVDTISVSDINFHNISN